MRVLGIDPGTLAMGYGLIVEEDEALTVLDFGVITASNKTPPADRLHKLYERLLEVMACHKPDEVAIEEPFVAKNARSALAIGRAQAVAMLAASGNSVPVYTYAPTKVKKTILVCTVAKSTSKPGMLANPSARRWAFTWSSSNRSTISVRATIPAAAKIPA